MQISASFFWKALLVLYLAGCSTSSASQEDVHPYVPFTNGANVLVAGHSFFVPVGKYFNELAKKNGFSDHSLQSVFAGGVNGSPSSLWDSPKKNQIENILKTGNIDLFGLTTFGNEETTSLDAYRNWFRLALSYNPDTAFFVGVPWITEGYSLTPDQFAAGNWWLAAEYTFAQVQILREEFPDNQVFLVYYGAASSEMYYLFDGGALVDVTTKTGGPKALFADAGIGHAGAMMTEMSALTWMSILYGSDFLSLQRSPYNEENVIDIMAATLSANEAFMAPSSVLTSPPTSGKDSGDFDEESGTLVGQILEAVLGRFAGLVVAIFLMKE